MLRKITEDEIKRAIDEHGKWIKGDGGKKIVWDYLEVHDSDLFQSADLRFSSFKNCANSDWHDRT